MRVKFIIDDERDGIFRLHICDTINVECKSYLFEAHENDPNKCYMSSTSEPQIFAVNTSNHQAAFEYIENFARRRPQGVLRIDFVLNLRNFDGDINFVWKFNNIDSIEFGEVPDPELIERWFFQVSRCTIPSVVIKIPRGSRMIGLGRLHVVKNAHSLIITGGECDITDEQLARFACDEINVRSINLTTDGIKRHVKKVTRHAIRFQEQDDWIMQCRIPADGLEDVVPNIMPPEYHRSWVVENMFYNELPPPAGPVVILPRGH